MFNSKICFLIFCILFGAINAAAQQDDVIKVDSSIVRLNVGVVDQKGRPITNLGQQDFTVYEDGVRQPVSHFEPTVAPFSVVLILDMSGSTLGFRETIRQSAFRFLDALAPEDRVAVIEFYDKVNLRNDFTTNRKTIANSINVANGRGKTQLYKALDFALDKLSKEGTRRKAIIVLTDGVDTALRDKDHDFLSNLKDSDIPNSIQAENNESLNRILNRSDAQGVTIYPIVLPTGDPAKLADPTPVQTEIYSAAQKRLKILATRTGGTWNAINRLEEMGRIYAEVAADLRALYTVEYQPSNAKRDGKFRTIKIEVDNPNLIARTRQGYVAK
ncbi:MAG: VWA domain-containing protein [Pyrinomonadaceae bacterium]